jgi:glutathione-independent formaldehyde dehydrogenase
VLNDLMEVTFVAGGVGIPGLYVVEDPGAPNEESKKGILKIRFGKGWSKSLRFHTGQAPVLQYSPQLMQAILHDRLPIAKIVNATVISLDEAAKGYKKFDSGVARKFILDPLGVVRKAE